MDTIRVLRIVEYVGPRDVVENQVQNSIHGQRTIRNMTIRATTLGSFPEILGEFDSEDKRQPWDNGVETITHSPETVDNGGESISPME